MPKRLEQKLEREASKRGFKKGSDRWNAYVYGTLDKIEAEKSDKSSREETSK